jgi:hypothetical protein
MGHPLLSADTRTAIGDPLHQLGASPADGRAKLQRGGHESRLGHAPYMTWRALQFGSYITDVEHRSAGGYGVRGTHEHIHLVAQDSSEWVASASPIRLRHGVAPLEVDY